MSDEAYVIDGVTITPNGGGHYTLSHPSLAESEAVRGKEAAEARAREIAANAPIQQGDLTAAAATTPPVVTPPTEIAALKAALAESEGKVVELQSAADNLAEMVNNQRPAEDVPPASVRVPGSVPRRYDGNLDEATIAKLNEMGLSTTRIVLEENEAIPPTGLYIGHNGRGYVIVPGVEVYVPDFLLEVLNNAVMSTPVVDPQSQKVLGYRNRSRYPYRKV